MRQLHSSGSFLLLGAEFAHLVVMGLFRKKVTLEDKLAKLATLREVYVLRGPVRA